MTQMTIGTKIRLLAGSLVALSLILGAVCLVRLSRIDRSVVTLTTDALPGLEYIGDIESGVALLRGETWKHVASVDASTMAESEQVISSRKQEIEQAARSYEAAISQQEDRANFSRLQPLLDRYYQAWETVLPLSRASKNEEAYRKYMTDVAPVYKALQANMLSMRKWNTEQAAKASQAAQAAGTSASTWTWMMLIVVLALGGIASFFTSRGIEHALLKTIKMLSAGANQVASAAAQVASSSQALAQGSSEQAASLEETSASSEEINSMAQRNSENSLAAAGLVGKAQQGFLETNQSLGQMVVAMEEINTQSNKISKIIKVIDEIAFQTNILALNAAVEAARAGESGMGFAVVADEVRNLAQRSAQAAKDTAELIEESIAKSKNGKAKVDEVNRAIGIISVQAGQVKTLVDEVQLGSQEQARGINEVGKSIVQMERVTQSSAASAEQSAAAAEELTAQSATLKDIVETLTAMVTSAGSTRDDARLTAGDNVWSAAKTTLARRGTSATGPSVQRSAAGTMAVSAEKPPASSQPSDSKNSFPMDGDFTKF